MFEPDALRRLVASFADPAVGGVCGRLVLEHGNVAPVEDPAQLRSEGDPLLGGVAAGRGGFPLLGGGRGGFPRPAARTDEPAYWDWEARLKEAESRLDSCLGANGAIYAIRTALFPHAIPDNTIVDDLVIGMKVREQGFRMVFEPRAVAREELPPAVSDEWRRRVRIGAGAYQALVLCRRCLAPRYGLFAWVFWSHKALRWLTPQLMLLALGLAGVWVGVQCSGFSVQGWDWRSVVRSPWSLTPVAVVLGAWVLCRRGGVLAKPIRLVGYFLTMQAALFVGFIRFCRGGLTGTWTRTERGGNAPTPAFGHPSEEGSGACGDQRSSPPRRG